MNRLTFTALVALDALSRARIRALRGFVVGLPAHIQYIILEREEKRRTRSYGKQIYHGVFQCSREHGVQARYS